MKRIIANALRRLANRLDPPHAVANIEPWHIGDIWNIGESYESKQVRDALVSHNRSTIKAVK